MRLFDDPLLFNYVIVGLYGANILWQSCHGQWWDAFYWSCALGLTVTVTFGLRH